MTFTVGFIIVWLSTLWIVDAWLLYKRGYNSTISATIAGISWRNPIVTLLIGIVIGHLLWVQTIDCKTGTVSQETRP